MTQQRVYARKRHKPARRLPLWPIWPILALGLGLSVALGMGLPRPGAPAGAPAGTPPDAPMATAAGPVESALLRVTPPPPPAERPPIPNTPARGLDLSSASVLVMDDAGRVAYAKGTRDRRPIASITKLMTAMVVLDSGVPLDTPLTIGEEDRDQLRHSRSRLRIDRAATLSRGEVLAVALMSSDNRAASALGRTTLAGGKPAFVDAMNRKAAELGMTDTHFADPTGLDGENRSTAEDLVLMVRAAAAYPLIREITTRGNMEVHPYGDAAALPYRNTNPLVRSPDWQLELSKTGFVNEAGHCLVMRAVIGGRTLSMVLLDSPGKRSPMGDSIRLRQWLEGRPATRPKGSETLAAARR